MDELVWCSNCKTGQIVITQFKIIQETNKNQFHIVADAKCEKCKMQYKLEGNYNSKCLETFQKNPNAQKMGFKYGIFWQGVKHDLSKCSPTKFFESVKYYQETSSPINAAKADKDILMLGFITKGGTSIIMNIGWTILIMVDKIFLCHLNIGRHYLGANHAYNSNDFSYYKEFKRWEEKNKHCAMNPALIKATTAVFNALMRQEYVYNLTPYYHSDRLLSKAWLKQCYDEYVNL